MILSGKVIQEKLDKEIIITPFNKDQLNPNSYNLRLHNELLIYDEKILDMKKENRTKRITIPEEGFVMKPNKLYLARTIEYTKTDYYVPMLEGRSSIARLGIFVHISSSMGHVGSSGYWTLELTCVQPVRIYANVAICQIFFHPIEGKYVCYENKYKASLDIKPSLLYKEFK
ncbi:dCTP deaminase [Candidatus Dependentiae bacterium]|nr:MAG: dCTP deaminase [Candidatus Dependentiae bacterium]